MHNSLKKAHHLLLPLLLQALVINPLQALFEKLLPPIQIGGISQEPSPQELYNEVGNEATSPIMQARLQEVLDLYKKKKLTNEQDQQKITIRYVKDGFLKNKKWVETANALSVNNDIWITKDHDNLPAHESKSQLAHEVAHYIFNNHRKISPLQLWEDTLKNTTSLAGVELLVAVCLWKQKPLLAAKISAISATHFISGHLMYLNKYEPNWVKKSEEIACDLLAAQTLPDGYSAGYDLYRRKYHLNPYRTSNDHPTSKTRMCYHWAGMHYEKFKRTSLFDSNIKNTTQTDV